MSERALALIRQLDDFRMRSAAKRQIVLLGAEAVEPLIEALGTRSSSVQWAVISALGEIGDSRAVESLVGLLGAGKADRSAVIVALEAITGEDFGSDIEKWRALATSMPEPTPAGQVHETNEALVRAATKGTDITVTVEGEKVSCRVALSAGRFQTVQVLPAKDPDGEELIAFYTECGPDDPSKYEWALRRNLSIPHGRYALRKVGDESVFVMVEILPRHSTDIDDVLKTIRTLAGKGDRLEKLLREEDLA